MKLLIINHSDKNGGSAIATHRIYTSLKKKINVYLYVINKNYKDKKIITNNQLLYFFLKIFENIIRKIFHRRSNTFHSYNLLPTGSLKIINKVNPDIVQLHWVGTNMLSIKEIGLIKKPIVWRLSDMWPMCASEHYVNKKIYKKKIDFNVIKFLNIDKYILYLKNKYWNKNIFFVAPSSWIKLKLKKSFLTKKNNTIIIPNTIDTVFWKAQNKEKIKKKLNIKNKIVITYGASVIDDPRKGLSYLLNSLFYLDFDYVLLLFGKISDKNFLKRVSDDTSLRYFGDISDKFFLRDIYSISDVVVIPSLMDNSPNVLFEANSCGVPVVAFNNSGVKDFILHRKTGWLANNKNSKHLSEGIEWCISNKNKKFLKNNARVFCVKNYSEQVISSAYIKLYKKIIFNEGRNIKK
jgi:glycosyltransferase involved in cell wall biosynthesis